MATNPSLILALISPCLIAYLGCEDERLLLVVKPVEARPVLSSSVIALPHALCRIVRLPKPAQNIHIRDLRGVENYMHGLHSRARADDGSSATVGDICVCTVQEA